MPVPRFRWVVAGLLFAAGVINYLDRAALGVAAPLISRDLGLSPSRLGLVFSTFFLGYTAFAFVGGHLADRLGPRRVYAWAAGIWSVSCALTAAVSSFAQLLVTRVIFGMSEGPMSSTANRAVANWFPRHEVSRAIGFAFSGQPIGSALAAPVVGLIAVEFGWRPAFAVIGAIGLVWVLFWRALATDHPYENKHIAGTECALISAGRALETKSDRDVQLLRYLWRGSTWQLGATLFAANYTLYIFISWLPSYITSVHHLSLRRMSFVAAVPWAAGFLGYMLGGWAADRLYARSSGKLRARKVATVVPLILAAVTLAMLTSNPGTLLSLTLIAIAAALMTAAVQSCWAILHELVPDRHAGSVGGFVHLLSNVSGIIGPTVTGLVIEDFGGYGSAFLLAAMVALAGAWAAGSL
jgi:MFS transporter, ACS family, hexuronate transporter